MAIFATLNAFNAGELSPKMIGRNDVSQYGKGCRTLCNFLVTPYGAVERRPGTRFLAQAKYSDKAVRLIRFVYSSNIAYVCEFGDNYIRFLKDGNPLLNDDTTVLELTSPYRETELDNIQFIQSADVMTLVHPAHPVMELKRTAVNVFTLAEKEYKYPPMLDPNLEDEHTLTPSALEGEITLTASRDTFTADNEGGYFQLIHTRRENEIEMDFKADGTSDSIEVYGYWTFTTHGTWTGNVTLQRSFDNGSTWADFRTYSSAKDSNTSTSGEEEERNVLYRIQMKDYEQSSSGTLKMCRCLLVNPDFQTTGVVRITAVESATKATAQVTQKLGGTDGTTEWNEGAWSRRRGFPCTISFYEERMMFGGTDHKPQTIWGSKTNAWDNFLIGSKDDDGLDFTLSSDTVNTICWLCQHDALIIGTMDSEWTLSASDAAGALTPSNFQVKRQSVYGSKGIAAQMVGETLLFVQRGARKVREFVFQWEKNGYTSPDMTVLADHITFSGIKATALQQLPDSILWCVLNDGTISALTYERDQQVVGWSRHVTDGRILSCSIIPNGNADEIYLAVRRGNLVLLEKMAERNFEGIENAFYVDSGITVTGNGLTSISGLGHLEGQTVSILADGAVAEERIVENGAITLAEKADRVTVGIAFESILSPMPMEIETQNGMTVLRKKCIGELRIRMYGSVGGEARCGSDLWQKIHSYDVLLDSMDQAVVPRDEVTTLNVLSGNDYTPLLEIRQRDPLPMNINSIVATYDVVER